MSEHVHGRRKIIGQMAAAVMAMAVGRAVSSDESSESDALPGESADEDPTASGETPPQAGSRTLGGMQFWGDLKYFQGFRIQRNVLTDHCRLLDADNRRYSSGTIVDCEAALEKIRQSENLQPDTGQAVIYLHGIGRSSRSLQPIIREMPREGYVHIPFEYPSTRVSLEQSAGYLHSVIESLTDVSKISFVVHSMGGLVVRRYLRDHEDSRLHRMVMMGTPNNGAELADMLKGNFLFRTIYGPAGQELVTDSAGTISSLPTPNFEFGIIAGGSGDDRGYNRLLPGDNDGTVTVASTRLAGAADFLRIPKIHSFLMSDPAAVAAVQHFIEHGRFFADRAAEPIR